VFNNYFDVAGFYSADDGADYVGAKQHGEDRKQEGWEQ